MNLSCYTVLLSATVVALGLFPGPTKLVSAQNENHPPSCPAEVASLGGIQNGSTPTLFSINGLIEVEFQFYFGCHETPSLLDEGVRLEVRFWSAASSIPSKWFPIRYYTPSLVVTSDDTSLVELDPSNDSVTTYNSMYNSSLPLLLVPPSQSAVLVREYICLQNIQNSTEVLKMQFRWMQRFGRSGKSSKMDTTGERSNMDTTGERSNMDTTGERSNMDTTGERSNMDTTGERSNMDTTGERSNMDTARSDSSTSGTNKRRKRMMKKLKKYAGWILDDISIRIGNGTHFLQVLSEDFNGNDINNLNFESYELRLAELEKDSHCKSSENDYHLQFNLGDIDTTTRYLIVNVTNISLAYEERADPKSTTTTATTGTFTTSTTTETFITPTSTGTFTTTTSTSTSMASPPISEGLDMASKLFIGGASEMSLQVLLDMYGEPLPQEISDIVISTATDILSSISSEADPKAGARVLELLDVFALRGYNSSLGKVSNDILTFQVIDITPDDDMNPDEKLEVLHEPEGTILLPGELFSTFFAEKLTNIRIVSFVFKNLSGILPENTDDGKIRTRLGSPILSATLWCTNRICRTEDFMLNNSVLFEIRHFDNSDDNEVSDFYFLNLEENIWSSRGCACNSALSNSSFSVCECDHLTHFAILLSPGLEIDAANTLALQNIGYVGVAVSVFCLIATIFTLTFLKELWGMRTFIHINLCVCLIISQVTFISAIGKTAIEELCQAIAIVLHYFFLTTFMWMLMEGVLLYVMLVRVFVKRQSLYLIGFTVVSYGLPALYVFGLAVPLGLTFKDDQGRPQYGSSNVSEACWLRYDDKHFIWAFISPVIFIMIINIGFFIMAISIMRNHMKKGTDKSKVESASPWLKTVTSLMVVMGIPWIIGIVVFHKDLLFVAYIFTIAWAFQGMAIFFLLVVVSKQVKDHYRSWWRSKKRKSEFLNKLFSSSNETQFESPSALKKRTTNNKTKNLGSDTASSSLQLTEKKTINRSENMCKYGDISSNGYANVTLITSKEFVNHSGVGRKSEGIYGNVNQLKDPKTEPEEGIDKEFSLYDITKHDMTSEGHDNSFDEVV